MGPVQSQFKAEPASAQDCQAATKDFGMLPCRHLLATASLTATPPSATRGAALTQGSSLVLPAIFRLSRTLREPVFHQGYVTDVHTTEEPPVLQTARAWPSCVRTRACSSLPSGRDAKRYKSYIPMLGSADFQRRLPEADQSQEWRWVVVSER